MSTPVTNSPATKKPVPPSPANKPTSTAGTTTKATTVATAAAARGGNGATPAAAGNGKTFVKAPLVKTTAAPVATSPAANKPVATTTITTTASTTPANKGKSSTSGTSATTTGTNAKPATTTTTTTPKASTTPAKQPTSTATSTAASGATKTPTVATAATTTASKTATTTSSADVAAKKIVPSAAAVAAKAAKDASAAAATASEAATVAAKKPNPSTVHAAAKAAETASTAANAAMNAAAIAAAANVQPKSLTVLDPMFTKTIPGESEEDCARRYRIYGLKILPHGTVIGAIKLKMPCVNKNSIELIVKYRTSDEPDAPITEVQWVMNLRHANLPCFDPERTPYLCNPADYHTLPYCYAVRSIQDPMGMAWENVFQPPTSVTKTKLTAWTLQDGNEPPQNRVVKGAVAYATKTEDPEALKKKQSLGFVCWAPLRAFMIDRETATKANKMDPKWFPGIGPNLLMVTPDKFHGHKQSYGLQCTDPETGKPSNLTCGLNDAAQYLLEEQFSQVPESLFQPDWSELARHNFRTLDGLSVRMDGALWKAFDLNTTLEGFLEKKKERIESEIKKESALRAAQAMLAKAEGVEVPIASTPVTIIEGGTYNPKEDLQFNLLTDIPSFAEAEAKRDELDAIPWNKKDGIQRIMTLMLAQNVYSLKEFVDQQKKKHATSERTSKAKASATKAAASDSEGEDDNASHAGGDDDDGHVADDDAMTDGDAPTSSNAKGNKRKATSNKKAPPAKRGKKAADGEDKAAAAAASAPAKPRSRSKKVAASAEAAQASNKDPASVHSSVGAALLKDTALVSVVGDASSKLIDVLNKEAVTLGPALTTIASSIMAGAFDAFIRYQQERAAHEEETKPTRKRTNTRKTPANAGAAAEAKKRKAEADAETNAAASANKRTRKNEEDANDVNKASEDATNADAEMVDLSKSDEGDANGTASSTEGDTAPDTTAAEGEIAVEGETAAADGTDAEEEEATASTEGDTEAGEAEREADTTGGDAETEGEATGEPEEQTNGEEAEGEANEAEAAE